MGMIPTKICVPVGAMFFAMVAACGGSAAPVTSNDDAGPASGDASIDSPSVITSDDAGPDTSSAAIDANTADAITSNDEGGADGTPTRTASCTPLSKEIGTAVDSKHGRMDGYLNYVVPKGGPGSCNGDSSHIHLQVNVAGDIYDVAFDIGKTDGDTLSYETEMTMPDGAWAEGWHSDDGLSYTALGLHSSQFKSEDPSTFATRIISELANANHVSIFGTGYPQGDGCHDVHYVGGQTDGALVINPLAATPHIVFVRFSTDSF
jgi:hypothetical protein